MKPKETKKQREKRLEETEGGRRFRSDTWSPNGDKKDKKLDRRRIRVDLGDCERCGRVWWNCLCYHAKD